MAQNFVNDGSTLQLAPSANVPSGTGHLFGSRLFGVALTNAATGVASSFATEGVWALPKTSALAIAVGDLVYWVPGSLAVNKTTAGQTAIGVAVSAAANPSPTVMVKLGVPTAAGT